MNKVVLTGRIEGEVKENGSEHRVLFFILAAGSGFKTQTNEEHITYVPCVLFNPKDGLKEKLVSASGTQFIELEGSIRKSSYTKNGEKRYTMEVQVNPNSVQTLGF